MKSKVRFKGKLTSAAFLKNCCTEKLFGSCFACAILAELCTDALAG